MNWTNHRGNDILFFKAGYRSPPAEQSCELQIIFTISLNKNVFTLKDLPVRSFRGGLLFKNIFEVLTQNL